MLLQVPSLNAVGIRSNWQLSALKELERTVKEVNLFVQVRNLKIISLQHVFISHTGIIFCT